MLGDDVHAVTGDDTAVLCFLCLGNEFGLRGTLDIFPGLAIRGLLPLIGAVRAGSELRQQGDRSAFVLFLHDAARRFFREQMIGQPHHTLGAVFLQVGYVGVPVDGDLVVEGVLAGADDMHGIGGDDILGIEMMGAPLFVVHQSGGFQDFLLAVDLCRQILKDGLVLVVHVCHGLHEAFVTAQFLQQADGFIHGDHADGIVEPAFRGDLHVLGDGHQELVQRASEGYVIVPGGAGDELVILRQSVPVHEQASGVAVVGLGDLVHEEHLGPGVQIEILLILFGIEVFHCCPGFEEMILDIGAVHTVILGFATDVLDGHTVVVAVVLDLRADLVHAGDLELVIFRFQIVVVLQCVAFLCRVVVILRGHEVVAQIFPVHPDVHVAGRQTDAQLVRQIHGHLVAHQGGIEVVGHDGPFFCFDAADHFHFFRVTENVIFVEGDVVRLLVQVPGGVAPALDADGFAANVRKDCFAPA